ncbi:ectoine/hydroxyectoine ABC transporter permease subunit EhuC [Acidiphilium sp. C61]|jgi:polar amino acid transport system permease protein|uniref:ectoine/hydroxyectoine ABC transporter permease subunit EhuC n=1 Tax=Acidiphilium sp. C61 TaxID=1671485 RepID=UPI00157A5A6A|nr:ectoine/hydroxyectoine ABC transporter permease subunit EhuC [Acidiphilium sp. C61]
MHWTGFIAPLARGAWITAEITAYSTVLGAALSFAAGLGRVSRGRAARVTAAVYIEIFRGTSLLVQMFWLYYALPLLGPSLSPMVSGVLALSLNIGAYGAEVVRGAINAVPPEQWEASTALSLTRRQALWRIIMPQALAEMMPPFGNLAIQNLKDTSLVSLITISDLTFHADALRNLTLASTPIYTLTLLMYFGMALVLTVMIRLIERWSRRHLAPARGAHA